MAVILISTAAQAFSEALSLALERELDIVTAIVDATSNTVPAAREIHPDIAFLQAPIPTGPLLARGLYAVDQDIRIIALVMGELGQDARVWASLRVAACLAATDSLADIIDATRIVIMGGQVCSPHLASALFRAYSNPPTGDDLFNRLTHRELELVGLLARGLSNKEIAQHLHVQVATVKNHLHSLYAKADVHGREELRIRLERSSWELDQN